MDAVIMILAFGSLVVLSFMFGLFWWGYLWLFVCVLLGMMELASVIVTKKTLSQQFWKFREKHKVGAYAMITTMILVWGLLIWHLFSGP